MNNLFDYFTRVKFDEKELEILKQAKDNGLFNDIELISFKEL